MAGKRKPPRLIVSHPLDSALALVPLADTGKFAVIDIGMVAEAQRYHWYWQSGYAAGSLPGSAERIGLHVLVWCLSGGVTKDVVDHVNRNQLDCRASNLRAATHAQNSWNVARRRNSVGFTGVRRMSSKFAASICVNGTRTHAYGFPTAEAAAAWRDAKSIELRGEFAVACAEVKH